MKATRQPHGITRRLIVYVVLFSSFVTFLITALQLFQEYRDGVSEVKDQIVQIEKLSLPAVTDNLWNLYEKQIQTQLEDLIQLPDVKYLEIHSRGQIIASTGIRPSQNTITKTLPLIYLREDEEIPIGNLLVVATLEGVYQELFYRIVVILISNGLKTALVSLFIFLIFQFLVTRHLSSISSHLQNLSVDHLDTKLTLDRRPAEDELNQVVTTINEMGESLSRTTVSKNYVNNIITSMADGLIVANLDTKIRLTNKRIQDLLDYDKQELIGESVQVIFEDGYEKFLGNSTVEPADWNTPELLEANCLSKNGKRIPVMVSVSNMRDENNEIQGIVYVVHDITAQKRIEEELHLSAAVFKNTNEGVIITDKDADIVTINQSFTEITGYTSEEVIGKNPKLLKSGRHDHAFYQTIWASIQEKGQWKGEIWNRRKNGEVYPQWLNISVVKNDQSEVINYVAVFSDISTLKQSEEQLEHLATHDTLTTLPNRLLFNDRLEHALEHAKRHGTKVSLLYMDLDNFKGINDSFGHPFGDRLLQVVADRLMTCVRSEDTVARLGGDEFTIITEDIFHSHDAAVVAHRVLDSLSKPIALEGHEIFTTASIGISLYPDHGNDVHVLMKNADTAMYHAKKLGRNKYQFYASEMTLLAQERIMLETALRYALERKEFILHYQPQVDVDRRQIVGVEALVRWQKPEKGLIFPNKFIPLSEEMGLISSIGEWVLHTACAQGHAWQLAGYPSLRIAVNISSREFLKKDFVEKVKQILKETGFASTLLEIEITESTLLKNIDDNIAILKGLKALGIHIAIDDFGIGYSSLSYLKQFSIDRLKIDRSFIKNIPHNSNDMAIAKAIIAIARSLGIQVTAEGVETQKQMDFLISEYCTEVQGYIFSPPVPAEEFKRLLDRRHWFSLI